jgi:hypothetical protein
MKLATFNVRAESVATKPMFRDAFKSKRCLIPASGYHGWQDAPGDKQPHYFTAETVSRSGLRTYGRTGTHKEGWQQPSHGAQVPTAHGHGAFFNR